MEARSSIGVSTMRVLFVYPNLYTQMGFNHGLASLSARLRSAGHETRLVNLNENLPPVPSDDEVWELLDEWKPGLIGFSCLSQQYASGLELAHWLRERSRATGRALPPMIVGGIHPTMVPDEVMADGVWDHVGVGECEDALLELVSRIERGEPADDVPNFYSWRGGDRPDVFDESRVAKNRVGAFPSLDDLPLPDYDLFETQRILDKKNGWFGALTSRGCPYRCTYCLNHRIVDRYRADSGRSVSDLGFFRFRDPMHVVDELRYVLERFEGIGTFILDDDLFTQNVEHALAFCHAYEESGLGIPYVVNAHVQCLDPRLAEALASSGCRILKFGIESGSPRIRKQILQRHMTNEDILETIAMGESHGIHTSGFVMVGLPGETREDRWLTVDLLARSEIGRFRTSRFFPFPGTESYEAAVRGGHIQPEQEVRLTDFTESSCMDFGAVENLLIDKLATCMPWFVNARAARYREWPSAHRYRRLVSDVLVMASDVWESYRERVRDIDAEVSEDATRAGELHYAFRYNDFMGVRSDYLVGEDLGVEWITAAAKPVPDELKQRALVSAAEEIS